MEVLRWPSFFSAQISTLQAKPPTQSVHNSRLMMVSSNKLPHISFSSIHRYSGKSKRFSSAKSSAVLTDSPEAEVNIERNVEEFDWFSQWYPIMPVCDLDKRIPHAKKVLGLDIVVWWDRNENSWKVFNDCCPHRLAPLSEGRIDQCGRLQCVYHGWCFDGSGDCKLIPQAPPDGPPVHSFNKACVAAYPSTQQHEIIWFWPSTDPQYKDIIMSKKPAYIPELDDPSFTKLMGNRDIPYGYEVLTENLMDPAHVPYAHYGIMKTPKAKKSVKVDREGGMPMEVSVPTIDIGGFIGKQEKGSSKFIAPCVFYLTTKAFGDHGKGSVSSSISKQGQQILLLIFICIPVSPGNSRLIWSFPRNFGVWIDRIVPRWMFHVGQNLILDSDLYLLHLEERKIMEMGSSNWQKTCFVPTRSDALVVAFRKWLKRYSGGQVNWGPKFSTSLPPTPPREQLLDRYRSHVVNCSSCRSASKWLGLIEIAMQILSIAMIGVVAVMKQGMASMTARTALVAIAVLSFVGSRWLAHFVYKNFHYHDYCHALR